MKTRSVFSELLGSIAERSLNMIDLGRTRSAPASSDRIVEFCRALLSSKGEATGIALAWQIHSGFEQLSNEQKAAFFHALSVEFGPNAESLKATAQAYLKEPSEANAIRISAAAEPKRQELIRRLNQAPDGTRRLVNMRSDLLAAMETDPDLHLVDLDFEHLLYSWFNRGFLELEQINWETSAAILERIIHYEAVHEISGWEDLRSRIDPPDRRLYTFFHPRLANDPLIFVEVALTTDTPDSIQGILSTDREPIPASAAKTAVFYSISNCQTGLRGISFGSFLIKQVVETLKRELPGLRDFITLSPIPGFADWLETQSVVTPLVRNADGRWDWVDQAEPNQRPEQTMPGLAAHYLLNEKNNAGFPRDAVARFHLGNGAILDRVIWAADTSPRGLKQSCSMMVNYRYKLEDIEKNHEAFVNSGSIASSNPVSRLAKTIRHQSSPVT
ncbi:MAG: malonyl-CoA decarboxylase [Alphaproteobacteria bacterium]